MSSLRWSHVLSAVIGGVIAAGGVLLLGADGRQRTVTYYQGSSVTEAGFAQSGSTLYDLYQSDAPAVVQVKADILERVTSPSGASARALSAGTSVGSGFLVDRFGDIVTTYRVVAGAARTGGVNVTFENDAVRPASVLAVRPSEDLAILRVDPRQLPQVAPLALGDSSSVRVGDPTAAIGNPFGADRTLSPGHVAALQHEIATSDGGTVDNLIQTDQPLIAGNEGGPLLSMLTHKVIGIDSEVEAVTGDGSAMNVTFAIPIDVAEAALQVVSHQKAIRVAYLGVGPSSAKPSKSGAVVHSVDPHGPAARAGIRSGDTIVRIGRVPVDSISDVDAVVSTLSPGDSVELAVRVHGHTKLVGVDLAGRTVPLGAG